MLEQPPDDTLCLEIVIGFLLCSMAGISTSKDEIDTFLSEGFHENEAELVIKVLSRCLTQGVQIICITHCEQEVNICPCLLVWAQQEPNVEDALLKRPFY